MNRQEPPADREHLKHEVGKDIERIRRANDERRTLLAQSAYIGIVGLIFVLPVIGGAYLGRWIDGLVEGYSVRWTLSFIFLGVVVGAANVYFYIRE